MITSVTTTVMLTPNLLSLTVNKDTDYIIYCIHKTNSFEISPKFRGANDLRTSVSSICFFHTIV